MKFISESTYSSNVSTICSMLNELTPRPDNADPRAVRLTAAQKRIHAAAMELYATLGVSRVGVSELASAAGIARGTVYKNVRSADGLFEDVATQSIVDMTRRVKASFVGIDDPAQQMAVGVRQYIRRAHEEPRWGRFMNCFGFSNATMQALWATDPMANLQAGIESRRYLITTQQLTTVLGMIAGATLAAMLPVLEGHGTWRDVGSDTAELLLIALGLTREEAFALARVPLPSLPLA